MLRAAFLSFFLLLVAPPAWALQPPAWAPGQTWQVAAQYRSAIPPHDWSPPVRWRYTVAAQQTETNELVVAVTPMADHPRQTLRMWFATDSLALRSITTTRNLQGRDVTETFRSPPGVPVVSEHSLIPQDWPVLPLVVGSRTCGETQQPVANFLRRETICQEVSVYTEGKLPEARSHVQSLEGLVYVRVSRAMGQTLFEQVWKPGAPFPVFGKTSDMSYWLE